MYEVGKRYQVVCESIDENGKAKFKIMSEDIDDLDMLSYATVKGMNAAEDDMVKKEVIAGYRDQFKNKVDPGAWE